MKILFISNLFPPHVLGGYEILCSQVCRKMLEKGHEVRVVTSTHGCEVPGVNRNPFPVYRVLKLYRSFDQAAQLQRKQRFYAGVHNYWMTKEVIDWERPDVIFVWSQLRLTLGAARAAEESGIPIAYSFNDDHISGFVPAPLKAGPKSLARYAVEKWIYPGITLQGMKLRNVTCISRLLKDNLIKKQVPIRDAKVIHQGIPIEQFPVKKGGSDARSPVRLLYVGQLHPYKGAHTFLKAVNRIASRLKKYSVSVSIAGEGPEDYVNSLKDIVSRGKARVHFLGKVPHQDLPIIYRSHDFFIFPPIWQEPFGLTHFEAMASGVPVVSTAHGGQGEFLEDGKNALVFEKENDGELAEKILSLIQNPSLAENIAGEARKMVEHRFTLGRYTERPEDFLWTAMGQAA